jgi:acetyl-CoA synthetase
MSTRITSDYLTPFLCPDVDAVELAQKINSVLLGQDAVANWRVLSQSVLKPSHSFELHRYLFEETFRDWPTTQGPPPAWSPQATDIEAANATRVMRKLGLESYEAFHAWSVQEREAYWAVVLEQLGIRMHQNYSRVLDLSAGIEQPRWLVGARLNIVESCFTAPDSVPAIIYRNVGGSLQTLTYGELLALTNRVANGLVEQGLRPGDAIAIDMPMTAEAVAIYLGIIKAGCAAISIADSFTPQEISTRLRLGQAKAIFTQDVILRGGKQLPLYQKVVQADAPRAFVLRAVNTAQTDGGTVESVELRAQDCWWETFLCDNAEFDAVVREPDDVINILFSSGTTGDPKAIPWTQTTPLKCAADAHFHQDVHPTDVVAWPTNLGWMMGPWLVFAALLNRATIALYEGAPTGREFGQFVQDAGVSILGVVPSLVQTWRRTRCMEGLDWSRIKLYSSTGETSNATDMLYCMSLAGYRPVIEYCGGTEIGGGYLTGTLLRPCAPATFNTPALGLDVAILDENGFAADYGELYLRPPSIGLSTRLLNKDHHEVYFAGSPLDADGVALRRHGDQMERLPQGYYCALGRADDTMNLGGIKVGSAEIERILNALPEIMETAAIAIAPAGGGPTGLVVYAVCTQPKTVERDELLSAIQSRLKTHLNPLFRAQDVVIVDTLPRTASNKILRRELRDSYIAHHARGSVG